LYREGKYLDQTVEEILRASGVDLSHGAGLEELQRI